MVSQEFNRYLDALADYLKLRRQTENIVPNRRQEGELDRAATACESEFWNLLAEEETDGNDT